MSTAEPRAEPTQLPVGTVVDGYRIEEVLGRGGMGFVYGVVNTMIGKRAAMKVLRPELGSNKDVVDRFITEARAVNQIGHPNIVDIFAFGSLDDDQPYMLMEWLRGETLGDRMARSLSVGEACELLVTIGSALEAAHNAGIAHRDLKPDNVFLAQSGKLTNVKLLDFGIAKLLTTDRQMEKTQTGMVMGTPAYMSPEQGRGKDVDHRTDIYSLGIIAFEMFCKRAPFIGETAMDLVVAHIHEPAPAPSSIVAGISPAIDSLVLSMLEKSPASRPTLPQITVALEEIRAGSTQLSGVPARRIPAPETSPSFATPAAPSLIGVAPPKARKRWGLAALAIGIAVAGGIIVVATRTDAPKTAPAPTLPVVAPVVAPVVTPPAPPVATPPPAPVREPAAAEVTIELTSTPPGARVRLAGTTEVLGTTPFSKKFPRSNDLQTFELELDGYQLGTQRLTMSKDAMAQVALVAAPAKAKPKTPVKKPPKKTNLDRGGTMNVFDE